MDRSRKKVRAEGSGFTNSQNLVPRVEGWMHEEGGGSGTKTIAEGAEEGKKVKSFKEVVSNQKEALEEEEDWWSNDRWKERIAVVMTDDGPNVLIPPQEKERLARYWKNALIVKPLG